MSKESISLFVEAMGVATGGGAEVLRGVLLAALEDPVVDSICIITNRELSSLSTVAGLLDGERTRMQRSSRALYYLRGGRGLDSRPNPVLLSLSGIVPRNASVPAVFYCQQGLPFAPEAMIGYPRSIQRRIKALRSLARAAARRADLTLVQSRWMSEALSRDAGRIEIVTPSVTLPGCDLEMRAWPTSQLRMLYVGSRSRYKETRLLVPLLEELRSRGHDVDLRVVGYVDDAASEVEGLEYVAWACRTCVQRLFVGSDLLILPSLVESAGLPLYEAVECLLPAIVPDLPYAREVLDSGGEYFAPGSLESLTNAVEAMIYDEWRYLSAVGELRALRESYRRSNGWQRVIESCRGVAGIW